MYAELLIYLSILVVIYFLTREWSNARTALLAAALWRIYIPAHDLISQVSGDLLAAPPVCLGILFTMPARQSRNPRYRHNYMIVASDYLHHVGGAEGLVATEALFTRRTSLIGAEAVSFLYRVSF